MSGISSSQTLKIRGYIKHHKVFVLIDNGSTHNFIQSQLAQEIHCYVRTVTIFQILIANEVKMKCGGWHENVKLKMGDYHLKSHTFESVEMGGYNIVLGAELLRTLGHVAMDFKELYMSFTKDS